MPQDLWSLSGGTYLIEKPDLAFQRESLGFSYCQGLQVQTPQPRNKKPGVERRAQPLFLSVAPREARQSLPCVRRCLTLGSDYCPADPTVNPLIGRRIWESPEPFVIIQKAEDTSSPCQNFF